MADTEREQAIKRLAELGWVARKPNNRGYIPYRCTCGGRHSLHLHKTPSNPRYYRNEVAHAERQCANWRKEHADDPT